MISLVKNRYYFVFFSVFHDFRECKNEIDQLRVKKSTKSSVVTSNVTSIDLSCINNYSTNAIIFMFRVPIAYIIYSKHVLATNHSEKNARRRWRRKSEFQAVKIDCRIRISIRRQSSSSIQKFAK